MHCQACGAQLPSEAKACPNCGTRTPAYYANSGASPLDPTIPAASGSSPYAMSAPPPSTQYGSNPDGVSLQSPYDVNPYHVVPPPPPPRKVSPVMLGILAAVVLLLVGASVGFVFLRNHQAKTNIPPTATTRAVSNTGNAGANATATAQSIAVAAAAMDPYPPTNGKLAFVDPLSQPYQWDVYVNDSLGLTCQFSNGAYHVSESKMAVYTCPDQAQFSNFAFEVQMTILHGNCGGIIFRINPDATKYYLFQVCATGYYELDAGLDSTHFKTLVTKSSPAITTGYNQLNTIAVVANGSTLDLYVNHTKIDSVSNSTSTGAGFIGLAAGDSSEPTEVAYSNAKVWTF
jgi:hypothetical protein